MLSELFGKDILEEIIQIEMLLDAAVLTNVCIEMADF